MSYKHHKCFMVIDIPIRKRTEGNGTLEFPNKNHKTKGEEKNKPL